MVGGMILSFLKWIVFSGVMQPADFGIYVTITTTIAFISFFGLFGLNEYLIKEGSLLNGRGLTYELSVIRNQVLAIALLNSIIIISLGLSLVSVFGVEYIKGFGYLFISGILLVNVVFNIIDANLRATMQFIDFAGMIFIRAALILIIGFTLASSLGLTGLLLAEVLSGFIAVLFGARAIPFNRWPLISAIKLTTMAAFLSKGRVFLGLQTSRYFTSTVDKWIVGWFAGSLALGHYSFILITFLGFMAVAGIFNAVITPKLISRFGGDGDIQALRHDILKTSVIFLGFAFLGAPLYMLLADLVIGHYFEKYAFYGLFWSLLFVYIGSVLHVTHHFFDAFFYSQSRQRELLVVNFLSLLFFLLVFISSGLAKVGVMYFAFSFMLAKAFLLLLTYYRFSRPKNEIIHSIGH